MWWLRGTLETTLRDFSLHIETGTLDGDGGGGKFTINHNRHMRGIKLTKTVFGIQIFNQQRDCFESEIEAKGSIRGQALGERIR